MLHDAADAALKIQELETLEMWNNRRGVVMLSATRELEMMSRSSWRLGGNSSSFLGFRHPRYGLDKIMIQSSWAGQDAIGSYGDVIYQLGISTEATIAVHSKCSTRIDVLQHIHRQQEHGNYGIRCWNSHRPQHSHEFK